MLMSLLNPHKNGYPFALFNTSNFGCTVINLLAMANYQNYYFYCTKRDIYATFVLFFFVVVLISFFFFIINLF